MAMKCLPTDVSKPSLIQSNWLLCLEGDGDNKVRYAPIDSDQPAQQWAFILESRSRYRIVAAQSKDPILHMSVSGNDIILTSYLQDAWYFDDQNRLVSTHDPTLVVTRQDRYDPKTKSNIAYAVLAEPRTNAGDPNWQCFSVGDLVNVSPRPPPPSFHSQFFTYTVDDAKQHAWDIIIIGSGMGGGVLAADIYEQNRILRNSGRQQLQVLVIEKGGATFNSHILNTSRPEGIVKENNKPYDWFFERFKSSYKREVPKSPDAHDSIQDWGGGPVYTLGGRSAVWGLSSPRIHDDTLRAHFDPCIQDALTKTYYNAAEDLLKIFLPSTKRKQQRLLERLNATADPDRDLQWQWGRMAADFREDSNYVFPKGAFSPIDKLMEIAMTQADREEQPSSDEDFRMLLGAEVVHVDWEDGTSDKVAAGVTVRAGVGKLTSLQLKQGGKVVLSAGSVHSPAILMRSGVDLHGMGGCHLTDHDLIYMALPFEYTDPAMREQLAATKFQSYVKLPPARQTDRTLATLCVDTPMYLSRSFTAPQYANHPYLLLVYLTQAPLSAANDVNLRDLYQEPAITIERSPESLVYPASGDRRRPDLNDQWDALVQVGAQTFATVREVMGLKWLGGRSEDDPLLGWSALGGVAHELGSIPMKSPDNNPGKYCLETDLSLVGHSGVYVCDNSVLPYNAEANPSLTLVALALRLSRETLAPTGKVTGKQTAAAKAGAASRRL